MIGERLRALRKSQNISQLLVAESVGISRSTYTKYETDTSNPDYEILIRIADYFCVSIDYLLGRTDHPDLKVIFAPTEYGEAECHVQKDGPDDLTSEELAEVRRILRERRGGRSDDNRKNED